MFLLQMSTGLYVSDKRSAPRESFLYAFRAILPTTLQSISSAVSMIHPIDLMFVPSFLPDKALANAPKPTFQSKT